MPPFETMTSSDEPIECPLCMEQLEVDDMSFFPCTCGYQICRFCWHRLKTDGNSLCPACRKPYSENPAHFEPLSEDEIIRIKKERRQKEIHKKQKLTENRRHLSDVRVVQKNLVFIVGLSQRLADVEVLKKNEYFGKFGKIMKVVINPSPSYAGSQTPSASAYVTYSKPDEALRAIQTVNNIQIDNRTLKASLGTTKYCSHFLKGTPCPKVDCMYLHDLGEDAASFTKEEMSQGKHLEYESKLIETILHIPRSQQNITTNDSFNNPNLLNNINQNNMNGFGNPSGSGSGGGGGNESPHTTQSNVPENSISQQANNNNHENKNDIKLRTHNKNNNVKSGNSQNRTSKNYSDYANANGNQYSNDNENIQHQATNAEDFTDSSKNNDNKNKTTDESIKNLDHDLSELKLNSSNQQQDKNINENTTTLYKNEANDNINTKLLGNSNNNNDSVKNSVEKADTFMNNHDTTETTNMLNHQKALIHEEDLEFDPCRESIKGLQDLMQIERNTMTYDPASATIASASATVPTNSTQLSQLSVLFNLINNNTNSLNNLYNFNSNSNNSSNMNNQLKNSLTAQQQQNILNRPNFINPSLNLQLLDNLKRQQQALLADKKLNYLNSTGAASNSSNNSHLNATNSLNINPGLTNHQISSLTSPNNNNNINPAILSSIVAVATNQTAPANARTNLENLQSTIPSLLSAYQFPNVNNASGTLDPLLNNNSLSNNPSFNSLPLQLQQIYQEQLLIKPPSASNTANNIIKATQLQNINNAGSSTTTNPSFGNDYFSLNTNGILSTTGNNFFGNNMTQNGVGKALNENKNIVPPPGFTIGNNTIPHQTSSSSSNDSSSSSSATSSVNNSTSTTPALNTINLGIPSANQAGSVNGANDQKINNLLSSNDNLNTNKYLMSNANQKLTPNNNPMGNFIKNDSLNSNINSNGNASIADSNLVHQLNRINQVNSHLTNGTQKNFNDTENIEHNNNFDPSTSSKSYQDAFRSIFPNANISFGSAAANMNLQQLSEMSRLNSIKIQENNYQNSIANLKANLNLVNNQQHYQHQQQQVSSMANSSITSGWPDDPAIVSLNDMKINLSNLSHLKTLSLNQQLLLIQQQNSQLLKQQQQQQVASNANSFQNNLFNNLNKPSINNDLQQQLLLNQKTFANGFLNSNQQQQQASVTNQAKLNNLTNNSNLNNLTNQYQQLYQQQQQLFQKLDQNQTSNPAALMQQFQYYYNQHPEQLLQFNKANLFGQADAHTLLNGLPNLSAGAAASMNQSQASNGVMDSNMNKNE